MSQTIHVIYTPSGQSSVPGTWTFPNGSYATIANGAVSQDVYFNLEKSTGWRYLSFLMRRITLDSSGNVVSSTGFLQVTGTSSKQHYPWGDIYVDIFDNEQIKVEVSNHNSTSDPVILGVELAIGSGTERAISQDPQIVLEPDR